MPATQTTEKPNFDTVWAIMQENAQHLKELRESQKETDRLMKESQKEAAERHKEMDRQMKESKDDFNRRIGSLTNLFGDFTVGMVAPKLCEKFIDHGYFFHRANKEVIFNDKKNKISFEVDILLENGNTAMLVEVKTKLTKERIIDHIERLEKMRKYADIHGDKRTFLGAVAGFALTDELRDLALEQGFYFIEPDGENFIITSPKDKLKEW